MGYIVCTCLEWCFRVTLDYLEQQRIPRLPPLNTSQTFFVAHTHFAAMGMGLNCTLHLFQNIRNCFHTLLRYAFQVSASS